MPSNKKDEGDTGPLVCMRDNVPASPEDPQCPHPSTSCPFRELCEVRDAMRRKKDIETAQEAGTKCPRCGRAGRRKKP
jgi:hypothetical protein